MPSLKIKDDYLVVSLNFWEGLFWPARNLEVPLANIESVAIENKMPCSVLCRKPVANIPGVICIGVFYPEGSIKESQLWCFTKKHKSFLNLVLKNGNYKKIVLGTSQEQAQEWRSKINEILQILKI